MYLTASNPNGVINGAIVLDDLSGPYVPTATAIGVTYTQDDTPGVCSTDNSGEVFINDVCIGLTIIYPIAS